MKFCSNRLGPFVAGVVVASLACAPHRASAQIPVTDVAGNAQWIQQTLTQIKTLAQEAQSYGTQLQQYQTQLQQYANMVTNTVALPQQVWSTVQSDIMRVQALSNAASLLSGNSGTLISRLQSAQGYKP
jgi:P-type conjugative transfer protein TrbJ